MLFIIVGAVGEMSGQIAEICAFTTSPAKQSRESDNAIGLRKAQLWNADWQANFMGGGVSERACNWESRALQVILV